MANFRSLFFFSFIVVFGLVIAVDGGFAEDLPANSWQLPFDVNQRYKPADNAPPDVKSQDEVYDFMWQTFVALNWPWLDNGSRGQPDVQGKLAPWNNDEESPGPVVWETYRRPNEVFYPPRVWPISWNEETPVELCAAAANVPDARIISVNSTNYSSNADGINQPFTQANYPTGPVVDQNGKYLRYEVGLNQAYFSYISHFRYFRPNRQIRAVQRFIKFVEKHDKAPPASNKRNTRYFQQLPNGTEAYLIENFNLPEYALQGIVEWKAAWKLLGGDDIPGRFYRRKVFLLNPDGSCVGPVLAGLAGLHVHRFTQFGHTGATFEQVDNTRLQSEYSSEQVPGAFGLPPHASLNPEGKVPPIYDNGYQVCDAEGQNCKSGLRGLILKPIKDGESLPSKPSIVNVARQVPIPDDVRKINDQWRNRLKDTVFFYYQMIGTQNKNLGSVENPNEFPPNPTLGPGVLGAQASNITNLINTTLESYTQKGRSCAQCHQNAFPLGVTLPFPSFEEKFFPLHTISFLLQNAVRNNRRHRYK